MGSSCFFSNIFDVLCWIPPEVSLVFIFYKNKRVRMTVLIHNICSYLNWQVSINQGSYYSNNTVRGEIILLWHQENIIHMTLK